MNALHDSLFVDLLKFLKILIILEEIEFETI